MWSSWQNIERAKIEQRGHHGIYQIRIVGTDGIPYPIGRFIRVDEEGVLYIGKAGPSRTLATRIREFQNVSQFGTASHSGGETYLLVYMNLMQSNPAYKNCKLQYRVMHLYADKVSSMASEDTLKHKIEEEEIKALADYFHKFGELPPCNSSFPGKFGTFSNRLQHLFGWSTKP
jgi:hypothetical protein